MPPLHKHSLSIIIPVILVGVISILLAVLMIVLDHRNDQLISQQVEDLSSIDQTIRDLDNGFANLDQAQNTLPDFSEQEITTTGSDATLIDNTVTDSDKSISGLDSNKDFASFSNSDLGLE